MIPARPAARLAAAVAALFVAVPAGIVVLNLFDRELDPEARAYFESGAPPRFSRDSGWALLMGFDAPPGMDPREHAGIRHRDVQRETRGLGPTPAGMSSHAVRGAEEVLCAPEKMDCAHLFKERPEAIAELAADNAVLLKRYDELQRAQGLGDASGQLFFVTPAVPIAPMMDTQRIRLSQVAALAARGRIDESAALLEADAAFFRRWLAEARTLLTKMLAVRGLSRDFLMAAEIARSARALSPANARILERVAAPLSNGERGLGLVLRNEAYILLGSLDRLVADPRRTGAMKGAANPFFPDFAGRTLRRGDTLNRAHPLHVAWEALDAIESRELTPALEAVRAQQVRRTAIDWTAVYNFAGRILVAETAPDVGRYVLRLRDLDALAASARCVVALRAGGVGAESAGAFLGQGGPACTNPLTGKPLTWGADQRVVGFRPMDPDDVRRFGGIGGFVAVDAY